MTDHDLTKTLTQLQQQISGILRTFTNMLDDDFLFAAAAQVPQVATIIDAATPYALPFGYQHIDLPQLLAMVAYRYGFTDVAYQGHGGYAIVMRHAQTTSEVRPGTDYRRVLRLVPDHHVQDVMGKPGQPQPFDVRLNAQNETIRDATYPLLLSDVFLLPRHTTRVVFHNQKGQVIQAGGKPAILHCQLLPQVIPLNGDGLNRQMAQEAGILLEAALATLGVSVADAHGGNGGILVDQNNQPVVVTQSGRGAQQYIPVVLDYGYYSQIEPKRLAQVLIHYSVTPQMMMDLLAAAAIPTDEREQLTAALRQESSSQQDLFAAVIGQSSLPRADFGKLLYALQPPILSPDMWIEPSEAHWRTIKERNYPPLHGQSRLNTVYPTYDEIIFPQRIEEYHFVLMA